MTIKERVKLYTTKAAIKSALKVLPKISDERWLSMIKGRVYRSENREERLSGEPSYKPEEGHSGYVSIS
ncbi:MAG: hypothetical protein U5N58_00715 [Actinomycetota bacterium]|nr:hypothetical protein [Actinomycetota bacterium]